LTIGWQQGATTMKTRYTVALSLLAGAALGAAAIHGLHAQDKPKAYVVSEIEPLDPATEAGFSALVQLAQKVAGGRSFRTGGGKVVAIEGAAPKSVAISEWDSLEQAQTFYNSEAWKALTPYRDKAVKIIRRYVVEATD
jgi:uncharacterized protein (DUF1330 family)